MGENTWDYVIAGGGTAGCVLANRLSEDPNVRVLMLEAGGSGRDWRIEVPLFLAYVLGNPKFDWRYSTIAEPFLDGRKVPLPRGKGLGGSSLINGLAYVRGHASDYDAWAEAGNEGWGWSDVLPYFMKSENDQGPERQGHGRTGEWRISDPGVRWPIVGSYLDAAAQAGVPRTDDYNSGENEGGAYFNSMIADGRRQSTEKAFLRPARDRANLTVWTGAEVDKLVLSGKRVTGVVVNHEGASKKVNAGREVILSAGAYGSPVIMERSGIGQPERLKALGITPVHDLQGVGENLQDHWQIRVRYKLQNAETLNKYAGSLFGRLRLGANYVLFRRGPMSASPAIAVVFAKSSPELHAPDLQIHVAAASYDRVGGPVDPFPGISSSVCQLRPEARGYVHANSTDPSAQPEILHNFLGAKADEDAAINSVKLVRRIMAQDAMAPFSPEEVAPGAQFQDRDALLAEARKMITTTFHPVGSCKMGDDDMAVVSSDLKVHGLHGLRVVDASIMPTLISGNTVAPSVMIGEKAADMIREDAKAAQTGAAA